MNDFNIEEYIKLKDLARDANKNANRADKSFMKLVQSKKDYERFLEHYCVWDYPHFNMSYCKLTAGNKPGYYNIEWNDNFHGETDVFWTRELSLETINKFLSSDDYFKEIDERVERLRLAREKREEEECIEREKKLYEELKKKYDKV